MITIPFLEYDSFSEDVVLDNIALRLSFFYNTRGEYWSMTISDLDDNIIISGIKLVIGYELIHDYSYLALPKGKLYIVDEANGLTKILQHEFINERRLQMVYILESEIESI
jgi:hypothetical protein